MSALALSTLLLEQVADTDNRSMTNVSIANIEIC